MVIYQEKDSHTMVLAEPKVQQRFFVVNFTSVLVKRSTPCHSERMNIKNFYQMHFSYKLFLYLLDSPN